MRDDFAVMICSHGRSETMTTYDMLRKQGYTGKIIVVIDDEDDQKELYESRYECVEVFSKDDYIGTFDEVVTGNRNSVAFARNACFDIAKRHGLEYFCEIDDDMKVFQHRYIKDDLAKGYVIRNLDSVFDGMCDILNDDSIYSLSFSKGSEFIGGKGGRAFKRGFVQTCHCLFCMKTDKRVKFSSTLYEDLNTSLSYNHVGKLFLGIGLIQFISEEVGNQKGGAQVLYEKYSSFARAFSVLIARPDTIKIEFNKKVGYRVRIHWDCVSPMIISDRWKK